MATRSSRTPIPRGIRGALCPLSPALRRRALDLLTRSPGREPLAILTAALNAVGREIDTLVAHPRPATRAGVPGRADLRALWLVLAGIDERLVLDLIGTVAGPGIPPVGSTPATAVSAIPAICAGCGYLWVGLDAIRAPALAGCRCFWCGGRLRALRRPVPAVAGQLPLPLPGFDEDPRSPLAGPHRR
jgi:hypothetical protein